MKRLLLILALICMIVFPVFSQTGSLTTNEYFYLPEYGASGADEYDEYNTYMQVADDQIEANKTMGEASVDTSGTPVDNDIAVFTDLNTIEGLSYSELKAVLDLEIGTDVQAYDAGLLSLAGLTYASDSFIKVTATDVYAIRTLAEVKSDLNLEIGTDVLAEQTIGISDDNLVEIDDADAAVDDYCKLTANGIVGRSYSEVRSDLSIDLSLYYLKTEMDSFSELQAIISDKTLVNVEDGITATAIQDDLILKADFADEDWGDMTVSTNVVTIDSGAVTYAKIQNISATNKILGRASAGAGVVEEIVCTSAGRDLIDDADASTQRTTLGIPSLKLSAFAATTSAELAGVISDEIGAGKLRFDTSVTTKTAVATLNVSEAGTILVSCAATPYTITLPTASGNTGLTYHFIKTDANYNLITLDGDGTETFNYENATGTPNTTYARLNTYCAEVTIVSDGSNWQIINEKLGQVPRCWAYMDASVQHNLTDSTLLRVELDAEAYDIGSNFDISTWVSGTTTGTSANHVIDSGGAFTSGMVNKRIKNTTDTTYTYITVYNSATDITVRDNIFVSGEGYEIKNAKFVVPIPGKYNINYTVLWRAIDLVPDKPYGVVLYKNEVAESVVYGQPSVAKYLSTGATYLTALAVNDYMEIRIYHESGTDTVDIAGGETAQTYMQVYLVSKD